MRKFPSEDCRGLVTKDALKPRLLSGDFPGKCSLLWQVWAKPCYDFCPRYVNMFALTAHGRSFKICFPAEVAQVVEHGTENAGVDSSSLSLGTTFLYIPHFRYNLIET